MGKYGVWQLVQFEIFGRYWCEWKIQDTKGEVGLGLTREQIDEYTVLKGPFGV